MLLKIGTIIVAAVEVVRVVSRVVRDIKAGREQRVIPQRKGNNPC